MEDYLLDCVEQLQRAGDDSGRRKSEIQRPKAWNLLSKEWKALAFLAVNQAAPESIDPDSSSGKPARPNRRIGRRGGRGGQTGLQDRLELPPSVIRSKEPAAYRLAVLIAQKHKMGASWKEEWNDSFQSLRKECETGVHPVWERMAREAPLLAELGRFPISENKQNIDAGDWLSGANFDPQDSSALLDWLDSCALTIGYPSSISPSENYSRPSLWKTTSTEMEGMDESVFDGYDWRLFVARSDVNGGRRR